MASPTIIVTTAKISDLLPYANNAREHTDEQVAQVAASIKEFGWTNPIIVHGSTVVAGHARLAAARKLNLTEVPVIDRSDMSEAQWKAYVLADNQLAQNATWNEGLLSLELDYLTELDFDLDLIGFPDLDALMGDEPEEGLTAPDDVPEPPEEAITQPGDLWLLGDHRLLCGDSTDAESVAYLMDGAKANVAFTSPPYASQRKYDESTEFKPIPADEYVEWFKPIQENVFTHLAEDGSWFVNITEASEEGFKQTYVKRLVLKHVDSWHWEWVEEYCWRRPALPLDPNKSRRFKNGWESVYHFATKKEYKFRPKNVQHESDGVFKYSDQKAAGKMVGGNGQGIGGGIMSPVNTGAGMAYPSNVLNNMGGAKVVGHSAAFPVGLPEFFINAFTDENDIVYEPFSGSGSTIIAAENTGRKCNAIELSPAYVDVTVARWEAFTGKKAELHGN